MILHPAPQGSPEWAIARSAIPTASEFDQLLSPTFEIRKGEMPTTYLNRKVAEWWQGGPMPGFSSFDTEQGKILEEECLPFYELEHGVTLQRTGLITSDDGFAGCSPDALIGDDCGLEAKCPAAHTHVGYLLKNELPRDYAPQVHGSMFVTGRPQWVFFSYRRHFPALRIVVERDEEIQETIAEALAAFHARFESAKARMIEINGGPPLRTV